MTELESTNQITVYQTPDENINIEVLYANENIWLLQKRMSELFGCSADNIGYIIWKTINYKYETAMWNF
jgi:hypothetical protein